MSWPRLTAANRDWVSEGWSPHIFVAILVNSEVDGTKRATADLLLHQILVDSVLCAAVIFAVAVLRPCIERFLGAVSQG